MKGRLLLTYAEIAKGDLFSEKTKKQAIKEGGTGESKTGNGLLKPSGNGCKLLCRRELLLGWKGSISKMQERKIESLQGGAK